MNGIDRSHLLRGNTFEFKREMAKGEASESIIFHSIAPNPKLLITPVFVATNLLHIPTPPLQNSITPLLPALRLHQHPRRVLNTILNPHQELNRLAAIDDAVVVGE